jgi:hypothetical protein
MHIKVRDAVAQLSFALSSRKWEKSAQFDILSEALGPFD